MLLIVNLFGNRYTFWPTRPQDEKTTMFQKMKRWIQIDDGILSMQILFAISFKIWKKKRFYMSINSAKPYVIYSIFDLS